MKRRQFLHMMATAAIVSYAWAQEPKGPIIFGDEALEITKEGIEVPHSLGAIIERHVDSIFAAGFASQICPEDFDHGHFLIQRREHCQPENQSPTLQQEEIRINMPEYFRSVDGFLYHTREYQKDWIPGGNNLPRSIYGFPNGSIAIPVLDSDLFRRHGTINGHEPFTVLGMQNILNDPHLDVPIEGRVYFIISQFFLRPSESGRYRALGINYDLWLPIEYEMKN